MAVKLGTLKTIFIIVALIYVISPWDILPDFLGLLGRVDDLLVVAFIIWRYSARVKQYGQQFKFYQEKFSQQNAQPQQRGAASEFDPYTTLELTKGASKEEITAAHRRLIALYHPDKVNHLGQELKDLAHTKTLEIQRAYEILGGTASAVRR